jgi:hypothetical protein
MRVPGVALHAFAANDQALDEDMPIPLPRRLTFVALLPLIPAIAGCTGKGPGYPSLAPRPIEEKSFAEPAPPPATPQVADPAAVARYAPTIERAHVADVAFRHMLDEARGALAKGRGAASGSDAWASAQVSLSRLQDARVPVIKALAELDGARDADPTHANTGEAIAATEAFDAVQQIDSAEAAALSAAWPQ